MSVRIQDVVISDVKVEKPDSIIRFTPNWCHYSESARLQIRKQLEERQDKRLGRTG